MSKGEVFKKAEAFYAALIDSSHDIIILTDENFKVTYSTPSADHAGWTTREGMKIGTLAQTHLDDIEKLNRAMKEVLGNPQKHIPVSFRTKHKAGHYIWMEGVMTNMLDDENVKGIVTNLRDVTERTLSEENLKRIIKEISDYKYAIDESSIVAITDHRGIIKHANDNFCNISKYSREELIGKDHRIINSGFHSKEFIRDLWATISKGKIWRGELKNKAKDGSIYWVDTTIVAFLDQLGNPYQYLALRSDITSRKQVEEKLAESLKEISDYKYAEGGDEIRILNKELEKRVKERTEELESFSYSVSHDLRAPLRAVHGYARILEEDYNIVLDAEGKRLLGEVQNNAKKMGVLIDDLLSFSRLGRKELKRSNINMNKLIEVALAEINQSAPHNAEIKANTLLPVMADHALLERVMTNLISNAIKYSSKKTKPVIEITSKRQNGELIYSVCDNGVGFDMQYAHKLFGVFQRLHTEEEFPGTGVGLAIVERIIHKHSGKIWAEGKLGEGATFFFSLPDSN